MTRVRQIIEAALKERPLVKRAYLTDALVHQQIEGMSRTLRVVEAAMRNQGVAADVAERVLAESVRVPFDQYLVEEQERSRLVRRLAEELNMPVGLFIPIPESDG